MASTMSDVEASLPGDLQEVQRIVRYRVVDQCMLKYGIHRRTRTDALTQAHSHIHLIHMHACGVWGVHRYMYVVCMWRACVDALH